MVCSRHHTLIHAQGFQLVLSPDRTLSVRTAGDIPVLHSPSFGNLAALPIMAEPLTSGWQGDPFDLGYVVMVMTCQRG